MDTLNRLLKGYRTGRFIGRNHNQGDLAMNRKLLLVVHITLIALLATPFGVFAQGSQAPAASPETAEVQVAGEAASHPQDFEAALSGQSLQSTTVAQQAACAPIDPATLAAPYVFRYGLTGSQLQSQFFDENTGYNGQGYRPVRLTGYQAGSQVLFATKWVRADGPEWRGHFGLTSTQYAQLFETLRADFRIIDVSGYNTPGGVRFAAIWQRNTDNVVWRAYRNITRPGMQNLVNQLGSQGWVPLKVEAYTIAGASRYISLWIQGGCEWNMHNFMTRAQYQHYFDLYAGQFRLVHLDAHTVGGQVFYSGIWWAQQGPASVVRSDRDWYLFQRYFNNHWCDGYVLDNFYAADVPGGVRYGGIWTFNAPLDIDANASLAARVSKHTNCAAGRAGAAVVNLTTGESTLVHADQRFGTASTIKSGILYALLRRIDQDPNVTLATQLNVGAQYGANTMGGALSANQSYSLAFLARTMIVNSNNWATNRLIDYVGRAQINQEFSALGLAQTRINRYMSGTGAPSAHGMSDPGDDYRAGWDNVSTPREMTRMLQIINANAGLLSNSSATFFWSTLNLDGNGAPNTKGYVPGFLDEGVSPLWENLVTIFNKAGSNSWSGQAGDFAHRRQIGAHAQGSEAGRLNFQNGQRVFYAVFLDEGDAGVGAMDALRCIGYEVVREYSGQTTGVIPAACQ
jgi:hypothetical protein